MKLAWIAQPLPVTVNKLASLPLPVILFQQPLALASYSWVLPIAYTELEANNNPTLVASAEDVG